MSERLVSDLSQLASGRTKPRPWLGVAACVLVLPIHLVTVGASLGGLWLLVAGSTWPLQGLGIALLVVAASHHPGS